MYAVWTSLQCRVCMLAVRLNTWIGDPWQHTGTDESRFQETERRSRRSTLTSTRERKAASAHIPAFRDPRDIRLGRMVGVLYARRHSTSPAATAVTLNSSPLPFGLTGICGEAVPLLPIAPSPESLSRMKDQGCCASRCGGSASSTEDDVVAREAKRMVPQTSRLGILAGAECALELNNVPRCIERAKMENFDDSCCWIRDAPIAGDRSGTVK
ncbi:predicted protein [Postia placenta Mad-698-R]|nr:predicted protein [Postia placenta Mad-698-R]